MIHVKRSTLLKLIGFEFKMYMMLWTVGNTPIKVMINEIFLMLKPFAFHPNYLMFLKIIFNLNIYKRFINLKMIKYHLIRLLYLFDFSASPTSRPHIPLQAIKLGEIMLKC